MPQWPNPFLPTSTSPPWNSLTPSFTPSLIEEKDHRSSAPALHTPMSSTAFDPSLPPPAVYSSAASSHRRNRKRTRFASLSVYWAHFKKRIGTGTAPSSSSIQGESSENNFSQKLETTQTSDVVDEVVVDRMWTEEIKSSVSHSEHGGQEKSGGSNQLKEGNSDHDSIVYDGCWSNNTVLIFIRWRVWPSILEIFNSRFIDPKAEAHYAQVTDVLILAI
jgi:osomolarity two-component system sensor histidine kinase SLN1